jgi:hypothetical protein
VIGKSGVEFLASVNGELKNSLYNIFVSRAPQWHVLTWKYNVLSKSYEPPKLQDYKMCLNLGKWFWGISLKNPFEYNSHDNLYNIS